MEKIIVKKKRHKSKHHGHRHKHSHAGDIFRHRKNLVYVDTFVKSFGKLLGLLFLIGVVVTILYYASKFIF